MVKSLHDRIQRIACLGILVGDGKHTLKINGAVVGSRFFPCIIGENLRGLSIV